MSASPDRAEERKRRRERRKRARRARKALLAFLKRLRRACGSFKSVDEWLEITQELAELLAEHREGLTQEQQERLKQVMKQADLTLKGVNLACKALQGEVEKVIAALPVGLLGLPVPALIALGVGVMVVGFGGVVLLGKTLLQSPTVTLSVVNEGCPPIALAAALSPEERQGLAALGITLPDALSTDEQADLRLPRMPVMLTIDARTPPLLRLHAALPNTSPMALEITLAPEVEAIWLDQAPILGSQATVSLAQSQAHTLVIRCAAP